MDNIFFYFKLVLSSDRWGEYRIKYNSGFYNVYNYILVIEINKNY